MPAESIDPSQPSLINVPDHLKVPDLSASAPAAQPELISVPEHLKVDGMPEQPAGLRPDTAPMHGGYTGIRVGEMGNSIVRLQEQGKVDEAAALSRQLDKVAPVIPQKNN